MWYGHTDGTVLCWPSYVNNHRKEHLKSPECVLAAFGTAINVIIFMNRPRIGLCGLPDTDSRRHANGRRNMSTLC